MALFDRFWKRSRNSAPREGEPGYYALYESQRPLDPGDDEPPYRPAGSPNYAAWDAQLSQIDGEVEREVRRKLPWWNREYWHARRKRWWAVRIVAACFMAFFLLVAWLAITAPLSKSLEPIAAPQITLLASDGTPIARSGAVVAEPVEVAKLPPHVVEAFLAIEGRRF